MKYWAQVENDIVVNVIVADSEFISTQDGEWIETDITRGNVHYGEDGQPDDGVPLRKNYAAIGHKYDRDLDAFYSLEPPAPTGWRFDSESCTWVLEVINSEM